MSDMDGTLLDPQGRLDPDSASLLRRLSAAGVAFTVATARTPATVDRLMAPAHPALPAVVMTGAALWDFNDKRYIDPRFIPGGDIPRLLGAFDAHGLAPLVYTLPPDSNVLEVYHAAPALSRHEEEFVAHRRGLPLKHFNLRTRLPQGLNDRVMLMFAMGSPAPVEDARRDIQQATACSVSAYPDTYSPGLALIEVFAPGVDKAGAVQRLARSRGLEHITAFGDNLNDLAMFEVAHTAVAVANAQAAVKNAADVVTGPNTVPSVAAYIARECGFL